MYRPTAFFLFLNLCAPASALAETAEYRLLATSKTSTMLKELNAAAEEGFRFATVMGGETSFGGSEVVVAMVRESSDPRSRRFEYRLLATRRTSTMEKELRDLGREGFSYCGQSVFQSTFGGREVLVILEKDLEDTSSGIEYRLLATSKTSTMQKELSQEAASGFRLAGLTVGETEFGGKELVSILYRPLAP